MILPNLILPIRANRYWEESGIDTLEKCHDKQRFLQYPDKIEYRYNSRGFRDAEWPNNLQSAIWCIGDSFTAGIGTTYEHTWPQKLSTITGRRIVNVSMDGASNNWIAQRVLEISQHINPENIVIMWSYVERREKLIKEIANKILQKFYNDIKDSNWPACPDINEFNTLPIKIRQELASDHLISPHMRISSDLESIEIVNLDELRIVQVVEDISVHLDNFKNCINLLKDVKSNLIYSFIPDFAEKNHQLEYVDACYHNRIIPLFDKLDLGRDGHHFDRMTSQWVAEQITPLLI